VVDTGASAPTVAVIAMTTEAAATTTTVPATATMTAAMVDAIETATTRETVRADAMIDMAAGAVDTMITEAEAATVVAVVLTMTVATAPVSLHSGVTASLMATVHPINPIMTAAKTIPVKHGSKSNPNSLISIESGGAAAASSGKRY